MSARALEMNSAGALLFRCGLWRRSVNFCPKKSRASARSVAGTRAPATAPPPPPPPQAPWESVAAQRNAQRNAVPLQCQQETRLLSALRWLSILRQRNARCVARPPSRGGNAPQPPPPHRTAEFRMRQPGGLIVDITHAHPSYHQIHTNSYEEQIALPLLVYCKKNEFPNSFPSSSEVRFAHD